MKKVSEVDKAEWNELIKKLIDPETIKTEELLFDLPDKDLHHVANGKIKLVARD